MGMIGSMFDEPGTDTSATPQTGNISPDFWHNLMTFGLASMAAGSRPGATTLGALGEGGLAAQQSAQQGATARANQGLVQADTQAKRMGNQLQLQQLNMQRQLAGLPPFSIDVQGNISLQDQGGNTDSQAPSQQQGGQQTPPINTAGMSTSPTAGMSVPNNNTFAVPNGNNNAPVNNPGNLRPVGASTGFQQFNNPQDGANAMTADLVTKISGKSPAMTSNFGQGYKPTLSNVIATYAPAGDNNNPQSYTASVSQATGIDPNQTLTVADIPKIQAAMTKIEGNTQSSLQQQPKSNGVTAGNPMEVVMGKRLPNSPEEALQAANLATIYGRPDLAKQLSEFALAPAQAAKTSWAEAPAKTYIQSMAPSDLRGPGSARINPYTNSITQIPNEINVVNPKTLQEDKKFVPLGTVTTPLNPTMPMTGVASPQGGAQPEGSAGGQSQGSGGNEQSYMTKAPPGQEKIVQELAENYATHEAKGYNAAQAVLGHVSNMNSMFDNLNNDSWFTTGTGAQSRADIAKGFNGIESAIGVDPKNLSFSPDKIANAEALNAETTRMGSELTQQYFGAGREAASTITREVNAVPGISNTAEGAKLRLAAIKEGAQYNSDLYNYKTQIANSPESGGNLIGAETAFNKMTGGPQAYAQRAISTVNPIPINNPRALKTLLPGTNYKAPDGTIRTYSGVNPQTTQ